MDDDCEICGGVGELEADTELGRQTVGCPACIERYFAERDADIRASGIRALEFLAACRKDIKKSGPTGALRDAYEWLEDWCNKVTGRL